MLRSGKTDGWLDLPLASFAQWATLNDVTFAHAKPSVIEGRGAGLIAMSKLGDDAQPTSFDAIMTVPKDLVLGLERVQEHAKADADFRELLQSIGEFGQTPRGAILTFLLMQSSMSFPNSAGKFGVHTAFTEYIKSLPNEVLPTFWTASELQLLVGTTLAPAVTAKLKSLRREYDHLSASASDTRWYRHSSDYLDLDDWLLVDAMYRSRALEYPGIGHCMVPGIDLANHASRQATTAFYEKDNDGNAVLLLRDGKSVEEGEEVTITYGDEKGACEMLFSYGFLEDGMRSAESLFLGLDIPDDDPQRGAKMQIADCAPGFKLSDAGDGGTRWDGDYTWLLCVNKDDGLRFELARTTDGDVEMHGFLNNVELTGGVAQLHSMLSESRLRDVYQLRAITVLQQRVFEQMQALYGSQDDMEAVAHGASTDVRDTVFRQAMKLRELEFGLMEIAYEQFEKEWETRVHHQLARYELHLFTSKLDRQVWEKQQQRNGQVLTSSQKLELAQSPVVQSYLAQINAESPVQEDFS